jgi:CrcB protein
MKTLITIALGGAVGSVARYYLSKLVTEHLNVVFPLGTLLVNLVGCLLIGFFFGLFDAVLAPSEIKALVSVGFIGGFTTFSTFALESLNLFRAGEARLAFVNLAVSVAGGLVCAFLGMLAAGLIFKKGGAV